MELAPSHPLAVFVSPVQALRPPDEHHQAGAPIAQKSPDTTTLMENEDPQAGLRDCVNRTRNGDQAAAEELVGRLHPLILKIVRRNLSKRDAEEDLVQEILVKVFSHLETFKEVAPFDHWVSRIAVNTCMNRLRWERTRPELRWADLSESQADALNSVISGNSPHPGEEMGLRDMVDQLLGILSPEDRLIIRLGEMDGLSIKEISSQTGWSSTLIRVRAFRARQKLNRKFAGLWKKGEL